MEECEAMGMYERSATLAIFHGDLRAAVKALQRGAVNVNQRLNEDEGDMAEVRAAPLSLLLYPPLWRADD
jgi:hypothetical protein